MAEMFAALLCSNTGIRSAVTKHQATHLVFSLKQVKYKKKRVVSVAGHAQKSADWMCNLGIATVRTNKTYGVNQLSTNFCQHDPTSGENRDAISTVNIEETMSRKKQDTSETSSVVAIESAPDTESDTQEGNPPTAKNWGPPYKAVFVSAEKGFELGENRRFNQRVFIFDEKPGEEVLAALKEAGFTYRAAEKAWTIMANAATRAMSDQMARDFAGQTRTASR